MATHIRLIGEPSIEVDGLTRPVRGHQTWAVLARILLSARPLDRRGLASEIFSDTADPLGSLRWSLAALRKALDCSTCLWNDPIEINFPTHVSVDVWNLQSGTLSEPTADRLLNGIEPRCTPEFGTWLLVERERIAALNEEMGRQSVLAALSAGKHVDAIRFAEICVRLNPLDERMHVLLVKSLAAAGRQDAALAQVEKAEALFEDELGERPSPALRSAARRTVSSPPAGISAAAYVNSLLEAGLAAVAAGASDAGIDCLRRAAQEADKASDRPLLARAGFELGTALVHSVRGHDDEGSILLLQSVQLAVETGQASIATNARRELGYVDALAGRRPAAASHLEAALASATNTAERAGVHSVQAFNLFDWGRHGEAFEYYARALDLSRSSGSIRREIWTLGMMAWGLLDAERWLEAEQALERCLDLVDAERWVSFRPWPVALMAQCRIQRGEVELALSRDLEQAYALSCQLGDPCWEGVVARAMGSMCLADGDLGSAQTWFNEGFRRSMRESDGYTALQVRLLECRAEVSRRLNQIDLSDELARQWVAQAARSHMDLEVTRAAAFLASGRMTASRQ